MTILKLPAAGDTATLHVARCEVVEGKFGEQVKFTSANGDQLFLPRETADRQLARQGFVDGEMVLYSDVDGTTLCFSRDPNKKAGAAPYWSISRVVPEDVSKRPSLTEAAKAEAERVRIAKGLPVDEAEGSIGKVPWDETIPPPNDDDNPFNDIQPATGPATATPKDAPTKSDKADAIDFYMDRAWAKSLETQADIGDVTTIENMTVTRFIAYRQAGLC